MQTIPGYRELEPLYQNPRTLIYRAIREEDHSPVILKTPSTELVPLTTVARYRYAFSITQHLQHTHICKMYVLIEETRRPILVMEDIQGQGLQMLMDENPLDIETTLHIASSIADALAYLHGQQVLHKDIKPGNIIYNPLTRQAQLIDFLHSSKIVGEQADWREPGLLEGTLAYISPEQTGRMNRQIDHRSDLYSLGVTLYEMLTGQVPFQHTDMMAQIHAHMAIPPTPPHILNQEIPEALSLVVMKLLEKMPEHRYQSAYGVKADLDMCLHQWLTSEHIRPFSLASKDTFPHLQISKSIYGRDKEIEILLQAFERIQDGAAEIVLISGYSGIGKTALVQQLYGPITAHQGRLIQGKHDALQNAPHEGLLQSLSQLVREVISMPEEKFHSWQSKLQDALGHVGAALVDLIPTLRHIVGEQPKLPPAPPAETQKRLQRLIQRFIQTFASAAQPLVLFIDDLQWAKASSIALLFQMLRSGEMSHLLLIGTYRDNEVNEAHPLHQQIKSMREQGQGLTEVTLEPLPEDVINRWLADTLNLSTRRTELLTTEIYRKTQGNPFFTERFLMALYEEKGLWLDPNTNQWKWDTNNIRSMGSTENVTDLMTRELKKLPQPSLQLLQWAACIGISFDLQTLGQLTKMPMLGLAERLTPALQEGFIVPVGTSYRLATLSFQELTESQAGSIEYRFVHDKLREGTLALLDQKTRQDYHFQLGQHLLSQADLENHPEQALPVVNQWNHCIERFTSRQERKQIARLNVLAGQRLMETTSYQEALRLATLACELLGTDDWSDAHPLAYDCYLLQATAAQMSGAFELANEAETQAEACAQTVTEKSGVLNQRLARVISTTDIPMLEATCMAIIQLFDGEIENTGAVTSRAEVEWVLIEELLQKHPIETLDQLPNLTDPDIMMQIKAFARVSYMFEWVPQLQQYALGRTIRLSLEHGNGIESPFSYMTYAIALAAQGNHEKAYQFGRVAMRVNEKLNDTQSSRRAALEQMYGPFIHPWFHPVEEAYEFIDRAIQLGLEHGNLEAASFSTMNRIWVAIGSGISLDKLLQVEQDVIQTMLHRNFPSIIPIIAGVMHSTCLLAGRPQVGEQLNAQGMLEEPILTQLSKMFTAGARELQYRRLERFLLLEDYDNALVSAKAGATLMGYALPTLPVFTWHYSVLLGILYGDASPTEQEEYKATLAENIRKLQQWGEAAPSNYLHLALHAQAEMAMLEGELESAEKLFDQAYQQAQQHKRLNAEGLILERAAQLFKKRGKERIAETYLVDAYNAYARWQAKAKTVLMEERYPYIQSRKNPPSFARSMSKSGMFARPATASGTSSGTKDGDTLDLYSILKANQAIAEEISLEKLLQKLMIVVVENAGAECGLLLLPGQDGLCIEAMHHGTDTEPTVLESVEPQSDLLATSVVHYVERTKKRVVLDNAAESADFANDEYILAQKTRSLLCSPLLQNQKLVGILYLENNHAVQVFTEQRCAVLDMLSAQIAVSIENARLYENLEEKVAERTNELRQAKNQLERTFHELETKHRQLQEAQVQLVQSEKMASLGTLVAGVAHEINNPCNYSHNSAQALLQHIKKFQDELLEMAEAEEDAELVELFQGQFQPMYQKLERILDGTERIHHIVKDLMTFSRLGEDSRKHVNILEDLRATLSLVQANHHKQVDFVCDFAQVPELDCWPAQLNQAFMNIMLNAVQAIQDKQQQTSSTEKGTLHIRTFQANDSLGIQFTDDGCGMSEKVVARVFEPFFTTRQVGEGTGLGLFVAFGIIEKHHGSIEITSQLGEGTTVTIRLPIEDTNPERK